MSIDVESAPLWESLARSLIENERHRQMVEKGYTSAHDKREGPPRLVAAARSYLRGIKVSWPWADSYWKPKGQVRNLIRAGALALAAREVDPAYPYTGEQIDPDVMFEEVVTLLARTLAEAADILLPMWQQGRFLPPDKTGQ